MAKSAVGSDRRHIALTGDIVAAYVSNNYVSRADLPMLVDIVHGAITNMINDAGPIKSPEASFELPTTAQIRKSIVPEGLTSFIDGRSYKTLKRHLRAHNLTPETYRARYGLPADYPLVCSAYSDKRSDLAKQIGLGLIGAQALKAVKRPRRRAKAS